MAAHAGTERVGRVYLALAAGGTAAAVWVSVRFSLDVAATVAALLPSFAGAYLSWAAFRADRAAAGRTLAEVADDLAAAVRGQWEAEVRVRRLNDPYPLPVAWRGADEELVEPWALLRETARGWPSGPPADPAGWAGGPEGLAGSGGAIAEVFTRRVPTRRLVVLGGPGSGKTMLMVRLLLALVERREPGGPVPVLFPLASWDPGRQPLDAWLAERLARDYAGLAGPAGDPGGGPGGAARALWERGLVLPFLDGFDELPRQVRGAALDAVNAALPLGRAAVLSSRVEEYRDTLRRPAAGVPTRLAGAAAIELRPLRDADIAAYLRRDAGGPGTPAAARWEPVLRLLGTGAPAAAALRTPLVLFLARTVYNPRPGEGAACLPDPAVLCDRERFPGPAAVRAHLFDAFVPAAYRPHPRHPARWSAAQAERAFAFLARHLRRNADGAADLEWWRLHRALPERLPHLAAGAAIGALAWLACAVPGRLAAAAFGLDSGWLTGPPAAMVGGLAGGIAGGTSCGLAAGLTGGVAEGLTNALAAGAPGPLATAAANGLAYGFAGGVVGALSRGRNRPAGPAPGRRRWSWSGRGCAAGFLCGGVLWFAFAPAFGRVPALAGALVNAVVYGLAGGAVGNLTAHRQARRPQPVPAVRTVWSWDWRGFAVGLAAGPAVGVTHCLALAVQAALTGGRAYSLAAMLSFICAFGLAVGLARGLRAKPADLTAAVAPADLLDRDHRTFRRLWAAVGSAVGAAYLLCYGVEYLVGGALPYGLTRGGAAAGGSFTLGPVHVAVRGLAYGVTVGFAAALGQTAWWHHAVARQWLALRGPLPRDLTAFLADAHERRGVLRRVGAVYQFRHIDLQHHLAAAPPLPAPRRPGPSRGRTAGRARRGQRSGA